MLVLLGTICCSGCAITVVRGESGSRERVHAAIAEVLDELDLRGILIEVGLDYPLGTGGSRLSELQGQKAAIASAVLNRPDLMALNEAIAVFDGRPRPGLSSG